MSALQCNTSPQESWKARETSQKIHSVRSSIRCHAPLLVQAVFSFLQPNIRVSQQTTATTQRAIIIIWQSISTSPDVLVNQMQSIDDMASRPKEALAMTRENAVSFSGRTFWPLRRTLPWSPGSLGLGWRSPSGDISCTLSCPFHLLVCRVFKKSSSNGRVTLYLGRRDFVDHVTGSDPVDGVLLVERCCLNDKSF